MSRLDRRLNRRRQTAWWRDGGEVDQVGGGLAVAVDDEHLRDDKQLPQHLGEIRGHCGHWHIGIHQLTIERITRGLMSSSELRLLSEILVVNTIEYEANLFIRRIVSTFHARVIEDRFTTTCRFITLRVWPIEVERDGRLNYNLSIFIRNP